jgi:deoxyribodipyrimidine photo-lyase
MHNRVRMVTASFLTKNLHLDWRLGEAYFAEQLIDYDPAVNNGNWQWSASTGCDAQPYFRIFNPWRQQQKFDKDCVYIKQWVPELEPYPAQVIHKLEKEGDFYLPKIVDLRKSGDLSKEQFKSVRMRS